MSIRRDGGIDDTYMIADSQQRDGDGENAERSGGLLGWRTPKKLFVADAIFHNLEIGYASFGP